MRGATGRGRPGWTRAEAVRLAAGGGAAVGLGALLGRRGDAQVSAAAPSKGMDAEILAFLLQLEQLQASFYREAAGARGVTGDLLEYVRTVGPQEAEHVRFLANGAGDRARRPLRSDFRAALSTPENVRRAAVDLEELTIAAYVGQGASLTRDAVAGLARVVSVEARQAAWIRDLAHEVPAPRAADPAHTPSEVVDALHARGLVR
jgi:hypothetical protein